MVTELDRKTQSEISEPNKKVARVFFEIYASTNKRNAAMTKMAQSYAEKYMKFVEDSMQKTKKCMVRVK